VAPISQWTFDGYVRWLRGLREQYKFRRDFLVDRLAEEFDLTPTPPSGYFWRLGRGSLQQLVSHCTLHTDAGRSHARGYLEYGLVELYSGYMPDKTDEEDGSVLMLERQF
jgi:DNA-binding transcriptional MocR family regulator